MRLDINSNGRMVLQGVSPQEWEHIKAMRKAATIDEFQLWVLSDRNFDGTVYVTVTEQEDKEEIVRVLKELNSTLGMEVSVLAGMIVSAWEREASARQAVRDAYNETISERNRSLDLAWLLKRGCKGCPNLKRWADDEAYCCMGGKRVLLDCSAFLPQYGENKGGTLYWGRKFYPHANCEKI